MVGLRWGSLVAFTHAHSADHSHRCDDVAQRQAQLVELKRRISQDVDTKGGGGLTARGAPASADLLPFGITFC